MRTREAFLWHNIIVAFCKSAFEKEVLMSCLLLDTDKLVQR